MISIPVTRRHLRQPLLLAIIAAAILVSIATPASAEVGYPRYALLLVNSDYSQALEAHADDGAALKRPLSSLGFRVTVYKNLSLKAMRAAVRYFNGKLEADPESIGLVYFVGYRARHHNQTYLLPARTDVDNTVAGAGLSLPWMLDELKFAGNRMTVVLINPYDTPGDIDHSRWETDSITATLTAVVSSEGGIVLGFPTNPDIPIPADSGIQQAYREHLIKSLSTPGVGFQRLFSRFAADRPSSGSSLPAPWFVAGPDAGEDPGTHKHTNPTSLAVALKSARPEGKASPPVADTPVAKPTTGPAPVKAVARMPEPAPEPVSAPEPPTPIANVDADADADVDNTKPAEGSAPSIADEAPTIEGPGAVAIPVTEPTPADTTTGVTDSAPATTAAPETVTEDVAPLAAPVVDQNIVQTKEQTGSPAGPDAAAAEADAGNTMQTDPDDQSEETDQAGNIALYLKLATEAFTANRLTTPADDSAYHWARQVLTIDPKNTEARRLIYRMINKYLRWATSHYQADRIDKARSRLRKAQHLKAYSGRKQRRMMTALDEKIRSWQPAPTEPEMIVEPKKPDGAWEKLTDWLSSEPRPAVDSDDEGVFSY
jgi:hypothetical protein